MKLLTLTLVEVLLFWTPTPFTTATGIFKPYGAGQHNTTYVHFSPLLNPSLDEQVDVWVPTDEGTYPTFYFLDGFGGITPGIAYNEWSHAVASYGIVVVLPWSLTQPANPVDKVPIFESVLEWAETHLEDELHAEGVDEGVKVDLENIVLGGHSAGAHVEVEYLKGKCGQVKGQVFLSPVDGMDPLGVLQEFCITPGEYLNYATPTLHIQAGWDQVPGSSGLSCAPEELSNMRFYNAMDPAQTPSWHINATDFAHDDILDDLYIETVAATGFCGWNPDLTQEQHDTYREFVAGQVATFLKALFTEDEVECGTYLSYLQDPDLMSVEVTNHYNNPTGRCPEPTCSWQPPPTTNTPPASTPLP